MGEPGRSNVRSSGPEYIGIGTRTGGTETSQYLEGKEINRDCPSSGERTGKSLNQLDAIGCSRFPVGVMGLFYWGLQVSSRVINYMDSGRVWEVSPKCVIVTYTKFILLY